MPFDKFQVAIAGVVLAGAALFGHWAWRANTVTTALAAMPATLSAEIGAATGAPNRVDVALTEVTVDDPATVWSVTLPRLDTRRIAWRRDFVGIEAAAGAEIRDDGAPRARLSAAAEASLVFGEGVPGPDALARLSLAAPGVTLWPDSADARAAAAELHLRPDPGGDSAQRRMFAKLTETAGAAPLTLSLDGIARFDETPSRAPMRLGALAAILLDGPGAGGLVIAAGRSEARALGRLTRSAAGWRGDLQLRAPQPADPINALARSGWITVDAAERLKGASQADVGLLGTLRIAPDAVTFEPTSGPAIPLWPQRQ